MQLLYLLSDSAYQARYNILTLYKAIRSRLLTNEQRRFNTLLGSHRIAMEQSFGLVIRNFGEFDLKTRQRVG